MEASHSEAESSVLQATTSIAETNEAMTLQEVMEQLRQQMIELKDSKAFEDSVQTLYTPGM